MSYRAGDLGIRVRACSILPTLNNRETPERIDVRPFIARIISMDPVPTHGDLAIRRRRRRVAAGSPPTHMNHRRERTWVIVPAGGVADSPTTRNDYINGPDFV
jgi:hypothetical protein